MCVIIDAPSLIPFFSETDCRHTDYVSLKEWVYKSQGKIVYGGSTFLKELSLVSKVIKPLLELKKMGKVVVIEKSEIDLEEIRIKSLCPENDFDDPHLIAIVICSGCKIICLNDPRAHKYLKNSVFYEKSTDRPKIYTGEKNKRILKKQKIANCCK